MTTGAFILPSSHIDTVAWDNCVANSNNGMIYASTTYLTAMADHWHGIVMGDYRAVMPIPWRMKFGFRYAYTPAFIQQLGLIGNYTFQDLEAVFRTLPDFLALADLQFNFLNTETVSIKDMARKTNFIIDLSETYETIIHRYRKDLKENIRKASGLLYGNGILTQGIELYRQQYAIRTPQVKETDYAHFTQLCAGLSEEGHCFVRCIRDETSAVLATAVLLRDRRRIYNIMNAVTTEGRKKDANDFLFDRILHEFAGQPLYFDFEGSDLPGVRSFYEKFGPVDQPYFYHRYNGLPWPLRLFK